MARIDAEDDDLMRYVVRRYAYDPQRRERRHQIVAAFDNEREWAAFLDQAAAQLRQDGAAGRVTDPHDHYTGLVLEPGYQRRQQNGRLIRRAIERGADISAVLVGLDLPSNMAVIRAERSRDEHMSDERARLGATLGATGTNDLPRFRTGLNNGQRHNPR